MILFVYYFYYALYIDISCKMKKCTCECEAKLFELREKLWIIEEVDGIKTSLQRLDPKR